MSRAKEILDAALALEPGERARLAHELIASLDSEAADEDSGEAWEQEIARRVRELEAGKATSMPADQVFEEAAATISAARRKR
jgi:putative addiction module component (TIGR02574 family)